jgi:uncharacterized protein (DUF427 family)
MSARVRDCLAGGFAELRHEPVAKRIRAELAGTTVVDSTRSVLVWEPRRVVPQYAVPAEDIRAELSPAPPGPRVGEDVGSLLPDVTSRRVLDPRIPFTVHSADGQPLDVGSGPARRPAAGFRFDDPDLAGYVALDFDAFDAWYEEDERNVAHPRDPFHRIDVLPSSRHVRIELDGTLLAESTRPVLLYETLLPVRFYLRPEDVVAPLTPTATHTWCAYKGQASYHAVALPDRAVPDLAWTYLDPLPEAGRVRGLVAFFTERVDVTLDGERRPRPITPWS